MFFFFLETEIKHNKIFQIININKFDFESIEFQ